MCLNVEVQLIFLFTTNMTHNVRRSKITIGFLYFLNTQGVNYFIYVLARFLSLTFFFSHGYIVYRLNKVLFVGPYFSVVYLFFPIFYLLQ